MSITFWQLGWRTLWRDLRSGELRLLLLAVTLAVAALTAVGFFADRLKGGLQRDARQLLGGDAVVASDNPAPQAFVAQARALGLSVSTSLNFPTMARAEDARGGGSRLVALKAVEDGYPLRGRLTVANDPAAPGQKTDNIPAPGEVWVDAALLEALGLQAGDALLLGERSFRIARVIVLEPDRGAGFVNFAPRAMIGQADIAATGLIQPASRVSYRLAVAGADRTVARYVTWATDEIAQRGLRGLRVESLQGGRPEMGQTLDRAEKFLNLVALLAALLSAVAVALAARGFASNHLDDCAMLRVLGLRHATIARSYTFEFVLAGLAASSLGVLLGYAVHHVFVLLLAGLVETALPASSRTNTFATGAAAGAGAGTAGDAARCRQPAAGLAGGAGARRRRFCRLAAGCEQRPQARADCGGWVCRCGGTVCCGQLAGRVVAAPSGQRGPCAALAGAGDAPDRGAPGLYRGAGQQPGGGPAGAGAAGAAAHRPDCRLAPDHAGRCAQPLCHQRPARAERGVPAGPDAGWRQRLRLVPDDPRPAGGKLGDRLRFDMAGVPTESTITSLRKVDWGSMRANFFAIYPVSRMPEVPGTYMSAFRAPATAGFDNALVRRFPNITLVDMSTTLLQVQRVLDQVSRAVEFLFGFTLAAGLVVLLAAVTATREERAREFAIMRAVGASAGLLRQVQRAELLGVGLLAGLLASGVAAAVGWALARFVFEFDWSVSWLVPLLGAMAGAVLALVAGWWGLRDVLRRPVVETLRRAAQ